MDELPDCLLVDILRRLPCDGLTFPGSHALVSRRWLQAALLAQQNVRLKAGAGMHGRVLVDSVSKFSCLTSLTLEPGSVAVGHISGVLLSLIASKLPALQELQVLGPDTVWGSNSGAGLSSLFGSAQRLQCLTLQGRGCPPFQVPETLDRLSSLKQLRLALDHVLRLPESLGSLVSSLELLVIKSDSLLELPTAIGNLQSLRKLEITAPCLAQLPESLCLLTELKQLAITGCKWLELLPESLGSLRALTSLKATNLHSLARLPGSLTDLQALNTLSVKGCRRLSALPYGIHGLSSLEALYVEECVNLRRFPDALYRASLHTLSAGDNLSGFLSGSHMLSFPSRLRRLSVSFLTAQSLPGESGLRHPCAAPVYLRGCARANACVEGMWALLQLPAPGMVPSDKRRCCESCHNAHVKSCVKCPLSFSVGSLCSSLPGLEEVEVSRCQFLEDLPPDIGTLENLRRLKVETCPLLTRLPASITAIQGLEVISVSSCKLFKALPDVMDQLSRLRVLELTALPSLRSLPLSLIQLPALKRLTLPDPALVADMPAELQAFIMKVQEDGA